MYKKHNVMVLLKQMEETEQTGNKKIITIAVSIIVIILVVGPTIYYKNQNSADIQPPEVMEKSVATIFEKMATLPTIDEANLQKKIQEIITTGKDADCDTLGDARYQFACHDFFRIKKN